MAKNIVLCSDGTGNSAGKARGTNVWRIFEAVDRSSVNPPQVAFYDNGVGTEGFKPLKLFGGAFGWGLSENLRDLYRSLVEQYEPGDQIFLFGFSRGAFTVAVLAQMIVKSGIIDKSNLSPREFDAAVAAVLKDYKTLNNPDWWSFRNWIYKWRGELPTERYSTKLAAKKGGGLRYHHPGKGPAGMLPACVRFVGVWDTVDAVGLPFDELTDAFAWLFPLRFRGDQVPLAPGIQNVYHALAVDEERLTFSPVLWEERKGPASQRVEQVWFAGVHSNVGGGYPNDLLSLISLHWMMQAAQAHGLQFTQAAWAQCAQQREVLGQQYNSRSGLSVAYRYCARDIADLCRTHGVQVKLHASVLERVRGLPDEYAPAHVPRQFAIVPEPPGPAPDAGEPDEEAEVALRVAQDYAWLRRSMYYVLILWCLIVVGYCALHSASHSPVCSASPTWKEMLVDLGQGFLPDFVAGWVRVLLDDLGWTGALGLFLVALYGLRQRSRRRIREFAAFAWKHWLGLPHGNAPKSPWWNALVQAFRKTAFPGRFVGLRQWLLPPLTLLLVFGAVGLLLVRWLYFAPRWNAAPATPAARTASAAGGPAGRMPFRTDCVRFSTGVVLVEGECYRITVEPDGWSDKDYPASPQGLARYGDRAKLVPFIPWRRVVGAPWFELMGAVGPELREPFAIGSGVTFAAPASGELYLFVNDAVYENNKGTAQVTVQRLTLPADCDCQARP